MSADLGFLAPFVDAVAAALAARLRPDVAEQPAAGLEPYKDRSGTAEHFACSTRMVDSWLAAGCPCVRLGGPGGSPRLLMSEVAEWLRQRSRAEPVEGERFPAGPYSAGTMRRLPKKGPRL